MAVGAWKNLHDREDIEGAIANDIVSSSTIFSFLRRIGSVSGTLRSTLIVRNAQT
jgi:hypothetical protein